MKKDLIFAPAMLLVGIALFLLRCTGMDAHIAISVVGIVVLAAYTVLTRKEWKIPVLEIIMRAMYGIALLSGLAMMNGFGGQVASIVHKASAALFVVGLVFLFVHKLISKKGTENN